MLIAILGLGWYSQSLKGTIGLQEEKLAAFNSALVTANASITDTNSRLLIVEQERKRHESSLSNINSDIDKAKSELDGLKRREATVVAKSGLVELKINKAFIKQQEKIACITGNAALCVK